MFIIIGHMQFVEKVEQRWSPRYGKCWFWESRRMLFGFMPIYQDQHLLHAELYNHTNESDFSLDRKRIWQLSFQVSKSQTKQFEKCVHLERNFTQSSQVFAQVASSKHKWIVLNNWFEPYLSAFGCFRSKPGFNWLEIIELLIHSSRAFYEVWFFMIWRSTFGIIRSMRLMR